MDIHKVKITPAIFNSTMPFICQFSDELTGQLVTLTEYGKYGKVVQGNLNSTQKVKEIIFNPKTVYEFDFDMDNRADENTIAYLTFWTKDPRVKVLSGKENKNHKVTYLFLKDETVAKEEAVLNIKDKRKALQKYEGFPLKGMQNIAYRFGLPGADKMDEDTLYVELVGDKGLLFMGENLKLFLAYDSEDYNTQLIINVRRAIEKQIVEQRIIANRPAYFINNHPVGDSPEAVIMYFENNKDFYSTYIIEKLDEKKSAEKIDRQESQQKTIEVVDILGLRNEAKQLFEDAKVLGFKGLKVSKWAQYQKAEDIQAAIAEAKTLIAEKKQLSEVEA